MISYTGMEIYYEYYETPALHMLNCLNLTMQKKNYLIFHIMFSRPTPPFPYPAPLPQTPSPGIISDYTM